MQKNAEIAEELEDLKRKIEEIQAIKDSVESQNQELRSKILTAEQEHSLFEAEVKSLKMELGSVEEAKEVLAKELGALVEAKEAAAKAFDAEKAKIMKELEHLKRKVEEIQTKKDLVEGEKDKLRLEILIAEQKHAMSELEVKRLKMDLAASAEAKEAAVKSFDAEKAKLMKEVEWL